MFEVVSFMARVITMVKKTIVTKSDTLQPFKLQTFNVLTQ